MMHEGELTLSDHQAVALIIGRFPQYRGQSIRRLKTPGTVNAIFRVGESATARFPLQPADRSAGETALLREAQAMEEFRSASAFPGPRPLGVAAPTAGYPTAWSLQSWLPGACPSPRSHESSDLFAEDLATLISSLREHPVKGRRFSGSGRGGVLRDHDDWMQECLRRSEGVLDVPRLRRLWERFRELPAGGADVMSHQDLIPANLLVDGERLSGVLDTGGFGPADPALDLVSAWHLLDAPRRQLLRERLDVGDAEWERGAGWAFQQAMGLAWYYRESNPVMSWLGRCTVGRLSGRQMGG